jgi:hypothetical protein
MMDAYDRKARLAPAILVILPLAIVAIVWQESNVDLSKAASKGGLAVVITMAIGVLLAALVRAQGKAIEPRLWAAWGGGPTLTMLRHSDSELSPATRQRYHRKLAVLTGQTFPSPEEERQDPVAADEVYQCGVDYLLNATRTGEQFSLIRQENMNYGFHRNLFGVRALGIMTALAGNLVTLFLLHSEWETQRVVSMLPLAGLTACTALLLVWSFVVTPAWVRIPAKAFARVLLAACDSVGTEEVNRAK